MSTRVSHKPFHTPAASASSPARSASVGVVLALIAAAAPALGGCSMSFPMSSLLPATDDVTGSNSPVPFGRMLEEEDRRREMAALATALDPQGDGSTIKWENPKTGSKGAISAVGKAYNSDSRICRAFLGELRRRDGKGRTLQGTACTVAAGEWAVRDTGSVLKST